MFQQAAEFSQSQAFNGSKGGLALDVDLYNLSFEYEVPLFFIQGEEDLMTLASTTKQYFDRVKAPVKKLFLIPGRGHDSAFIEDNYKVMQEYILPLINHSKQE